MSASPKTDSMKWWRCHHGAPSDPKWTVIGKRLGVRRGEVWAVASYLFDEASQANPRGSIMAVDLEEVAAALEFDHDLVQRIFDGLREKDVHDGKAICHWDERQPKREDPSAAERKQRQRDKNKVRAPDGDGAQVRAPEQAENGGGESHAPSRNVTQSHEASRPEERREDEIRGDHTHTLSPAAAPAHEGAADAWPHGLDLGVGKAKRYLRKVFDEIVAIHPIAGNASIADAWDRCRALFEKGELPGPRLLVACAREHVTWQAETDAERQRLRQAKAIPVALANWFAGKRWEPLLTRAAARLIVEDMRGAMMAKLQGVLGPVAGDMAAALGGVPALVDMLAECEISERPGGLDINFRTQFRHDHAMGKLGALVGDLPPELIRWGVQDPKVVQLQPGRTA